MARKEQEQAEAETPQKAEDASQQVRPGVVEVEINLQLLNQKINFIIAKLDEISNRLDQSK